MKFIFTVRNLFILLCVFASQVFATPFDNPYQGNIAVQNQSENDLKTLALEQVLIKVSGNANIVELPERQGILKNKNHSLSQFGYKTINNHRYFSAVFDKYKINNALKEMQQPIWGDTRPTTLVWLVKNDGARRKFVSEDTLSSEIDSGLTETFNELQNKRGINLQFPLMDLDDTLALSVSDIAGRFYEPIATASKRYGLDYYLIGYLRKKGSDSWSLSWTLVQPNAAGIKNKILASGTMRDKKTTVIANMVSSVADYYASQYAILENQNEKFSKTIYVDGIDSLAKLNELDNVLSNLFSITSFNVSAVKGSLVTINIKVNGGLNSFKNGLFAQENLHRDSSQNESFYFHWR